VKIYDGIMVKELESLILWHHKHRLKALEVHVVNPRKCRNFAIPPSENIESNEMFLCSMKTEPNFKELS